MVYQEYEHSTDDVVKETGKYTCEAGVTRKLYKGDKFPSCPNTEVVTFWKHSEEHEHETGETVSEPGQYVDEDGDLMTLDVGTIFPNCPKSGNPTTWKHAGNV